MESETSLQRVNTGVQILEPPGSTGGRIPPPHIYSNNFGQENGLLQYWPVLRKHRWTILAAVVIAVTLATVISLRTTPIYDATGRISINRENPDLFGLKGGSTQLLSTDDWDYTVALDTQVRILQSDALAMEVAKALQLDKNPPFVGTRSTSDGLQANSLTPQQESALLNYIHDNLKVAMVPKTRLIDLRFSSPDPQMAARVVNTVINNYIEQNFKTKFESAMQTSDWLSKQLADLQLKVETSQAKLVRYQRENGIVGLDEKQNIVTAKLDELNRQLTQAEVERIQKESRYRLTTSGNAELISAVDVSSLLPKLHGQESDLKTQIAQAEVQLGPSHPKYIELKRQLAQVQADIGTETDKLASRIRSEYQAAQGREELLRGALEDQKHAANSLNESAIEYSLLKRDVDSNRELYEGLLQKLKEAGVTAGLKSGNIRVVDLARVPLKPTSPNPQRNIMLGFAMGLVGGLLLAFVLEAMDNTVRTPDQAQMITSLPALGIIPTSPHIIAATRRREKALPSKIGTEPQPIELVTYRRPNSEISESYRALRTSILLSSLSHPPRVLLVTSSLPQEGKTTTCVNTAVVLAQKGAKVLLVDADLRRPSIHRLFNVKPKIGLSTILTGTSDVDSSIAFVPNVPNLYILPAGPPPPHPAELLSSNLMKQLITQWRTEYDHIIIDTPPTLSVTDAVLLSVDVDSVVLVIRSASTTKAALRRAHGLLAQVNAPMLGVVVNAVDINSPDYYHYYYYGSKYGGYGQYYREEPVATEV